MIIQYLSALLLSFILFIQAQNVQKCPQLRTYDNPKRDQSFYVKNFLRIPKTNILVINTSQWNYPISSIVYYYDMSSSSGEVINVIAPDFLIGEMYYNDQTQQLVIINQNNLIFADPYTLKSQQSFSFINISSLQLIQGTNYVILTSYYNVLQIFDFIQQQVVLLLDNTQILQTFSDNSQLYQYYSSFYQLSTGEYIIVTTNDRGIITWSVDLQNLTYSYNGYIQDSIVDQQGDGNKCFTKHPTQDIIFMGGKYLVVAAVKIIDIKKGVYQTLFKQSIYSYYLTDNTQNIVYDLSFSNGSYSHTLIINSQYYVFPIYLSANDDYSQMSISSYYWIQITCYFKLYKIQENPILIISSGTYITVFHYTTYQFYYYLYFGGDTLSRRFIRQDDINTDKYIFLYQNYLLLYDDGYFGQYDGNNQKPELSGNVRYQYGSFYSVKNLFDWYFIKSGEDGSNSFIFTFPIYPLSQQNTAIDITNSFGLTWASINQNLDPFSIQNKIYVALAFPNKANTENYLFQLINCQSTTERYFLTSNQSDVTSIQTAFAIASLDDPQNLELIGVDNNGTVYIWDLSTPNYEFKFSYNFSICKNSQIGDIFNINGFKRIIMSCDDNKVYALDYLSGNYQYLAKLTSQPLALRAFSKPQLIALGDFNSGEALIFKLNQNSKLFDFFLQLQSKKIQDKLIYIEMLSDYTLWIQYTDRNLFYSIQDCLSNSTLCTQCTQQYYFNTTNQFDVNAVYGAGAVDNPYTTSDNFLTAMIKAQYYKQIVSGVSDMSVNIYINPDNEYNLNPNLMNFDFNSIISLFFLSSKYGTYASLNYQGVMKFNNYNQITIQDMIINFTLNQQINQCGIIFQNIGQNAIINNIQLKNLNISLSQINCQSIQVDSTQLIIQKYNLSNEDFSYHQSIIAAFNSSYIQIYNLSLINCTLGNQFSILQQQSNIQANVNNLLISQNTCFQKSDEDDKNQISILFQAGLFAVSNMQMNNNTICMKSIFSTVATVDQVNQTFQFTNISIANNKFQARTTYVFFDALYSMRSSPSHQLILQNLDFDSNFLIKNSSFDLDSAQLFETYKIATLNAQNITMKNNLNIQFGLIQIANTVNISLFSCLSDKKYFDQVLNIATSGCFSLSEIYQTIITQNKLYSMRVQDINLISLENNSVLQATLQIFDSNFTDLILYQQGKNTQSIPIQISTTYNIEIQINNCNFQNILLQSIQYTQTYSSIALWIVNYQGSVLIKKSYFLDSYSNSQYGFAYIETSQLSMDQINFSNSTFINNQSLTLYNSIGCMVYAKAENISITNCNFSKATASKGGFLYLVSSAEILNLQFNNVYFTEGYASVDASAIFIDTSGQKLNFSCLNCSFSNLFTLPLLSSAIQLQQYQQSSVYAIYQITFDGGLIYNIQGVSDNYFISLQSSEIQFFNIIQKNNQPFQSDSLPYIFYQGYQNKQQSTLIKLTNSQVQLKNCTISDLSVKNLDSNIPLLIQSQNSTVQIFNSSISDCSYVKNFINIQGGSILLDSAKFLNINQQSSNRILSELKETQPSKDSTSLIMLQNSQIYIQNNCIFYELNCQSCNGVIQLQNGNLNIDNSIFNQTRNQFGGFFFINGLQGKNSISNSIFYKCQSQYDGGAMYIQSQYTNAFQLNIDKSIFQNNTSINGKGGAIFIYSENLNPPNSSALISESIFVSNFAQIAGAIYQQNISAQLTKNQFEGNVGYIYGSNLISYASKLNLVNLEQFLTLNKGKQNQSIEIMEFRSGGSLKDIQFQLTNEQNECIIPITYEEIQSYKIQVKVNPHTQNIQSYQLSGDEQVSFNQTSQSFSFSQLTVVGTPNSSVILQFYSDQIYTLNKQTNLYEQNYTFDVNVYFRDCISGEQKTQYNLLIQCDICKKGQYSFNVQQCQECPKGAECLGGDQIVTNYGYWRRSGDVAIILSCENQESNCVGGSFGNNICYEGHIGALCEECDIEGQFWGEKYSKTAKYSCALCSKMQYNSWIIVALTFWTLCSMLIAIRGNISSLKIEAAQLAIKRTVMNIRNRGISQITDNQINKSLNASQIQKNVTQQFQRQITISQKNKNANFEQKQADSMKQSICIKMFTNYFQIVGSIATFNLTIPSGIFELPQSVGNPIKQTMSSLDCLLVKIETEIPIIFFRMIFSQIIPILYLIIFFLGLLVYHYWINKKKEAFPIQSISTASMFLIIYTQPDIVAQIIALLSCRNIGDKSYILSNVSFECYTSQHIKYILAIVLPLLIIWLFILPITLFVLLKKNQDQLESTKIKLKYGFLYIEYKNQAFYWEFVKMVEKITIILSLNFYSQMIIIKGILVFLSITLYGILTIMVKPYKEEEINQIDINSTIVCSITVLLGIFIYQNPFPYFYYPSFGIILLINSIFIISVLKEIIYNYYLLFKQVIKNLIVKLSVKIHLLKRFTQTENNTKKLNPEIKAKIKRAFQRYLDMNIEQRKQFFIKVLETQLSKILLINQMCILNKKSQKLKQT
ncbi:transmembrane protein, putative (macronuclear) [Tetrahymena thermophila SB210]|uniref:Transmembrane protein, putative n=1 Tax=Tetrahymena thermophila (strain SB210) TaxID=312017 RepID=Q23J90_TETTS|nr:transmembrane protein, putative [Tetrahymena thermophila SB210]EAR96614.2 transmembrane protein, putative [Tetrahymena thermophila SB210]|eukprot:XP_001016859.2 transmembrane protein, putative [Tetrahymena thermophila SB210]